MSVEEPYELKRNFGIKTLIRKKMFIIQRCFTTRFLRVFEITFRRFKFGFKRNKNKAEVLGA